MKSRYCYCPMTAKKIGRRVTLIDRIRKAWVDAHRAKPDVFTFGSYNAPVYPGK